MWQKDPHIVAVQQGGSRMMMVTRDWNDAVGGSRVAIKRPHEGEQGARVLQWCEERHNHNSFWKGKALWRCLDDGDDNRWWSCKQWPLPIPSILFLSV
ncbi:SMP-30/gluconolactonase/LRE family protein [Sesbania bispinosa]|nr:SMP-30/gluconolactonase/LRE family protein [Sesbania bispinosa]